jgi:lysophospholipase-2
MRVLVRQQSFNSKFRHPSISLAAPTKTLTRGHPQTFSCAKFVFLGTLLFFSTSQVAAMATAAASQATKKAGALIFLHGLGDTPSGWSSLQQTLPSIKPRLSPDNIHYVFPPAPTIGLTINGGMEMPGWFDLYDWPIGVSAKEDPAGLQASVQQIQKVVTELETKHGIDRSRIVLGGFSQGGAVALLAAYGYPVDGTDSNTTTPFAGCAALSGWICPKKNWNIPKPMATETSLLWAHGTFDDKVLFEQQAHGIQKLEDMGVTSIESQQYHIGHSSDPKEIEELAIFVDQVLFRDTAEDEM